jgi:hypothetical protein
MRTLSYYKLGPCLSMDSHAQRGCGRFEFSAYLNVVYADLRDGLDLGWRDSWCF